MPTVLNHFKKITPNPLTRGQETVPVSVLTVTFCWRGAGDDTELGWAGPRLWADPGQTSAPLRAKTRSKFHPQSLSFCGHLPTDNATPHPPSPQPIYMCFRFLLTMF